MKKTIFYPQAFLVFTLLAFNLISCVENEEGVSENLNKTIVVDNYFVITDDRDYNKIVTPPILDETIGYSLMISKINSGVAKWCHVRYKIGAVTGLDQYDNTNLYYQPYQPNIYTTYPNFQYNFFTNYVAPPGELGVKLSLAVSIPENGYYEIAIGNFPNPPLALYGEPFISGQPIYLIDTNEHIVTNLQEGSYVFYSETSPIKIGRFMIDYHPPY